MIAKQENKFIKGALFLSYTSMKDFEKCPRSFYLKDIYRDPETGFRMQIPASYMTLGALVHDAIKWFLQKDRLPSKDEIIDQYRNHWRKYRGKRGGFVSLEDEAALGKRGLEMLDNFYRNFTKLEPNMPAYGFLRYILDEKIILNGKVDFLGLLPDDSLRVVDFKTGKNDEKDPIQLHIYAILAESNFQKPVSKIGYWYLDREDSPKNAVLDPLEGQLEQLERKALEIEQAVKEDNWVCVKGEALCEDCRNYQAIIDGKGEYLFSDEEFRKDIFYLDQS